MTSEWYCYNNNSKRLLKRDFEVKILKQIKKYIQTYTKWLDKVDIVLISMITVTGDIPGVAVDNSTFLVTKRIPNTKSFTWNRTQQKQIGQQCYSLAYTDAVIDIKSTILYKTNKKAQLSPTTSAMPPYKHRAVYLRTTRLLCVKSALKEVRPRCRHDLRPSAIIHNSKVTEEFEGRSKTWQKVLGLT